MEQPNANDLFELKLNDTGIVSIRKFVKAAGWIFGLVIFVTILNLGEVIINFTTFKQEAYTYAGDKLVYVTRKIQPYFTIAYCVMAFCQVWYYRLAAKKLSFSIKNHDEISFNEAFSAMSRNAIFGIVTILLAALMGSLWFYILVKSL